MTVFEMAKKYYPTLWDRRRVEALVTAGRLTAEQAEEIMMGAGTMDAPIPYSGNMALEAGKYYAQDGVIYRCTRDTTEPVCSALAELVGLYVEVARTGGGEA